MKVLTRCPAKINTFLSVGPPDPIGYHPIRSIFRTVSLCDDLVVQDATSAQDEIVCHGLQLPEQNTLTRTLRLLRELVPVPPLAITLTKNIPAESGLGGGSSDAAGLLRALHRVGLDINPQMAQEVAFAVGADVPFFLHGGSAIVTGYGEQIQPIDDLPAYEILIIQPDIRISTREAYQELDRKPRPFAELPQDLGVLYNDFERVSPCICGEIAERLRIHGASSAQLTGSGSAVFGFFDSAESADQAKVQIESEQLGRLFRCHTLTRAKSQCTTLSS